MGAQSVGPEGRDEEAKLHDQVAQQTSSSRSFRCVAHGEHVLATAHRLLPPACTCSPLTTAFRPAPCCTGSRLRPPPPPPSAARSPPLTSATPGFSSTTFVLFSRLRGCSQWLRGGLEGGLALHDGDFGGFWRRSSAAAMIVRLVRRGCASRRRRATRRRSFSRPTRGWRHAKKSAGASVRFPRSDALCGCPRV